MNYFAFILVVFFLQDIPFKPKAEFEIKLDYQFKPRPLGDHNTIQLGSSPKAYDQKGSSAVLPYLILNIRLFHLPWEKSRMKLTTNLNERPVIKKVSTNSVIALDLGFTDDMIDRVKAHEYTLVFTDEDKNPVNKILITVGEDGSFLVNGETRGKF